MALILSGRRMSARVAFLSLLAGSVFSQPRSPSDLIKYITFQVDRPGREAFLMGMFSCGQGADDGDAVQSLVDLGTSAVPELEKAFRSLQSEGERSRFAPNSSTLLLVYARIQGRAAYPWLEKMVRDPRLEFLLTALDLAIASSLSLTSHVSASRGPERIFNCAGPQAHEALDRLILAWAVGDRAVLDETLASGARTSLDLLLSGRGLDEYRRSVFKSDSSQSEVGYKFQVPGGWTKPDGSLDVLKALGKRRDQTQEFSIETVFTTGSGVACGSHRLSFLLSTGPRITPAYLVETGDIGGLLRTIALCGQGR